MTRHPARLVHDDYRRIFVKDFDCNGWVRLDIPRDFPRPGDFNAIAGADQFAFLRAHAVEPHDPARDHLLRRAPRRSQAGADEVAIQPFAALVHATGNCGLTAAPVFCGVAPGIR